MKTETSSGGILFKKTNSQIFILLLKDKNNFWSFPKGLIEEGEEKEEAARREITEEVGLIPGKMICELKPINYYYKWKEDIVKKRVYFFLFEYLGIKTPTPQTEEGISEVKWFSLGEALQIIGYPKTNKAVVEETKKILNTNTNYGLV